MLIAIVAALAFLFLGGSGTSLPIVEQIQERVPAVITDKSEAKAILKHAKEMDSVAQDALMNLSKDLEAWSKADKDHSVGLGAFKQVLEKSADEQKEARTAFLDKLFEIKMKMNKEQWQAVFEEAK